MYNASTPFAQREALRAAELRSIGEKTVAELGEGWSIDRDPRVADHAGAYLNGPEGARLYLYMDFRDHDYLKITTCYPCDYSSYHPKDHSIRVRRNRGARVVASEITRRLMPGYLPDLAVAQERERQAAEAFQARARAAELICAALPGKEMPTADPKHHRFPRINLPYGQVTGHIDIHYNGDSELELHNIPPATVVRILELIRASKPA